MPNWRRVIWETIAIVAVWVGVNFATSRILLRLQRLEDFLRVCAWCKKVEHDEQWVPFEQFLDRGLNTRATHGMCPHCASQFAAGVRAMAVKRN